ncbi:MAG: hypothetical protein QW478_07755 [Candidatus Micrarchaeaceae archaeon]
MDINLDTTTLQDMPKYNNFGWQLNRLEKLVDICMDNYARLGSTEGRDNFATAVELLFTALSPKLTKDDRTYLDTYVTKLRQLCDSFNAGTIDVTSQQGIIRLRKFALSLLKLLIMVKDRRGLGIPTKKKSDYIEELATSLDVMPESKPTEDTEDNKDGAINEL